MKRKSDSRHERASVAKQLNAVASKLEASEPGFRMPEFVSDEDEIAWLDRNHGRLAELTLKHGARVQLLLKEPTKQISIRLPVRDLERAKKIAGQRKVNYQSVIKRALRRGLAVEAL
jgi:predicted DNA binding CopG/RHH family protein